MSLPGDVVPQVLPLLVPLVMFVVMIVVLLGGYCFWMKYIKFIASNGRNVEVTLFYSFYF